MLNSTKYESLLSSQIIPDAMKLYGKKNNFIFVQDNAPCHKTKKIIDFLDPTKLII